MTIDHPAACHIPKLRLLWKKAFGDTDAFLDVFFSTGYDASRCRCIQEDEDMAAALYWFDMTCSGQKFAYIYAVATDPDFRGRGLCRMLMDDTAAVLKAQGYDGAILVPQDAGLRIMYGKMGYLPATTLEEAHCAASVPCSVEEISVEDYACRRKSCLPAGGMLPEQAALDFLSKLARFYAGEGFLAAVSREEEHLRILEYLGDRSVASALVAALGHREATLRTVGAGMEFAMYLPLTDRCCMPEYFPFAFD